MVGYSGTPLCKKLGWEPGMRVLLINAPQPYLDWLGESSAGVTFETMVQPPIEAVHLFTPDRAELETCLTTLRDQLAQSGVVWISWPKKASRLPTDITEDVIRDVALPMGFVDIKVCAVSDIWSGLKLVIRKSERT